MNSEANKVRVKWIDIIKGICIIFVMLSHSYSPNEYRSFFTPFFLTMFFFASGYTFSLKGSFKEFIQKKFYHLIIPLLLLGTIRIVGMWILGEIDFKERFLGLLLQINGSHDELWFISCIFTSSLLFYLIVRFSNKVLKKPKCDICILVISIIVSSMGFIDIIFFQYKGVWEAELACFMLSFFCFGYLYRIYEFFIPVWLSVVCFAIYVGLVVFVSSGIDDIHMEFFTNPSLFIISSLLIILPFIRFTKWIEKKKFANLFIFLGQNTLFYFAFSGFVREIFYKILHMYVSMGPYIESILCTIVMILVLIFPAKIVRRYTPWLIGV